MASEVDICNLALSHFGQDTKIDAIDPPDGSAEADHAAIFYPLARDELLEMHAWTFASRRATLAELTNDREDWAHRYQLPSDCLKPRAVLPAGYGSSEDDGVEFQREGDSIYTDAEDATLVYTFKLTDPTKFSPLFTIALSWLLGSYISGPITKDPTGRTQSTLLNRAMQEFARASASNANTSRSRASHVPTAQQVR